MDETTEATMMIGRTSFPRLNLELGRARYISRLMYHETFRLCTPIFVSSKLICERLC